MGPVAVHPRVPALGAGGARPAPPRRGHRVEGLAQDGRGQGRHREVATGGAVAVVVEREPGPVAAGVLLAAQLGVLVGVDERGVVLDRGQRPASESPQLDRVDPPRLRHERLLHRGELVAGEPGRQSGGGVGDHGGVLGGEGAVGERVGGDGETVMEVGGQLDRPGGGRAPGPGLPREPRAGRRAPRVRGHRRPLGPRDQCELHRMQSRPGPRELGDRGGVLIRRQPRDLDPVQRLASCTAATTAAGWPGVGWRSRAADMDAVQFELVFDGRPSSSPVENADGAACVDGVRSRSGPPAPAGRRWRRDLPLCTADLTCSLCAKRRREAGRGLLCGDADRIPESASASAAAPTAESRRVASRPPHPPRGYASCRGRSRSSDADSR